MKLGFSRILALVFMVVSAAVALAQAPVPTEVTPISGLQQVFKGKYHLTSSLRTPKIFIKEFGDFLMSCHQHCLGVNLLVQR